MFGSLIPHQLRRARWARSTLVSGEIAEHSSEKSIPKERRIVFVQVRLPLPKSTPNWVSASSVWVSTAHLTLAHLFYPKIHDSFRNIFRSVRIAHHTHTSHTRPNFSSLEDAIYVNRPSPLHFDIETKAIHCAGMLWQLRSCVAIYCIQRLCRPEGEIGYI